MVLCVLWFGEPLAHSMLGLLMDREITSTALQWLFGINKALSELVGAGVIVRGEKRGTTASPTKNQTSFVIHGFRPVQTWDAPARLRSAIAPRLNL
jgi:hypothetical protein